MILPISLVVIFALTVGVYNYVSISRGSSGRGFALESIYLASFVSCGIMLIVGLLAMRAPRFIFTYIHWGWFLGCSIVVFLLCIFMMVLLINDSAEAYWSALMTFVGLLIIVFGIVAPVRADKHTYEITKPQHFNLLNNLPADKKNVYYFELTEDIDFTGKKVKDEYGRKNICYSINGNGHTVRGIRYERELKQNEAMFIGGQLYHKNGYEISHESEMKNIIFEDMSIILTPNAYNEDIHEGIEVDFALFSSNESNYAIELSGVTVKASVRVTEAVENYRSINPSEISAVLIGSPDVVYIVNDSDFSVYFNKTEVESKGSYTVNYEIPNENNGEEVEG